MIIPEEDRKPIFIIGASHIGKGVLAARGPDAEAIAIVEARPQDAIISPTPSTPEARIAMALGRNIGRSAASAFMVFQAMERHMSTFEIQYSKEKHSHKRGTFSAPEHIARDRKPLPSKQKKAKKRKRRLKKRR